VLNDYIDRDSDRNDVESHLTRYWRVFGTRPLPAGMISRHETLLILLLLVGITGTLILTLPFPNSAFVLLLMISCYCAEIFYQVRKRNQRFPLAQLAGRTDFALFPVAGYLCIGTPDMTALLYFLFSTPSPSLTSGSMTSSNTSTIRHGACLA
jgi:4-hydroxybenzoate polyprenyltransferase